MNVLLEAAPSVAGSKMTTLAKKKILLADDDPAIQQILYHLLTDENYSVLLAANGEEALKLADITPLNLVLLDLNMPVKNGWDTFEQLTSKNPLVPIIVITARPNQYLPARASGIDALMEKPLDLPTLLETIRELLQQPAEAHLARLTGKPGEFRYVPPKTEK